MRPPVLARSVYGLRPPFAGARTARQSRRPRSARRPPPIRPPRRGRPPTTAPDRRRPGRPPGPARLAACASSSASCSCPAATETTARDADSPKSVAMSSKPAVPAATTGEIHVDARRATETALGQGDGHAALGAVVRRLEEPLRGAGHEHSLQRRLALRGRARGGTPRMRPCIVFRYSLPPSSLALVAEQDDRVAAVWNGRRTTRLASSIRPTTPSTGVGSTPRPSVSL